MGCDYDFAIQILELQGSTLVWKNVLHWDGKTSCGGFPANKSMRQMHYEHGWGDYGAEKAIMEEELGIEGTHRQLAKEEQDEDIKHVSKKQKSEPSVPIVEIDELVTNRVDVQTEVGDKTVRKTTQKQALQEENVQTQMEDKRNENLKAEDKLVEQVQRVEKKQEKEQEAEVQQEKGEQANDEQQDGEEERECEAELEDRAVCYSFGQLSCFAKKIEQLVSNAKNDYEYWVTMMNDVKSLMRLYEQVPRALPTKEYGAWCLDAGAEIIEGLKVEKQNFDAMLEEQFVDVLALLIGEYASAPQSHVRFLICDDEGTAEHIRERIVAENLDPELKLNRKEPANEICCVS